MWRAGDDVCGHGMLPWVPSFGNGSHRAFSRRVDCAVCIKKQGCNCEMLDSQNLTNPLLRRPPVVDQGGDSDWLRSRSDPCFPRSDDVDEPVFTVSPLRFLGISLFT